MRTTNALAPVERVPGADATRSPKEADMPDSVYKLITLVGSSTDSWEKAAASAVSEASKSLRDLRVARVVEQDIHIEDKKAPAYRVKLEVSFKYEGKD
jgi:dodecin